MRTSQTHIFIRMSLPALVAVALAFALSPAAFASWSCTRLDGVVMTSYTANSCAQYYPDCSSTGGYIPPACLAPFTGATSSTQTTVATVALTSTQTQTQTQSYTYTYTSITSQSYTNTQTTTATTTTAATDSYTATATDSVIATATATTIATSISPSDAKAAEDENKASFEHMEKLQVTMSYAKDVHQAAVNYYDDYWKTHDKKAFNQLANIPASEVSGKDPGYIAEDGTSDGAKSNVSSSAGSGRIASGDDGSYDQRGYAASKNGTYKGSAMNDGGADVKALLKASFNARVAALVGNSSLRLKLASMLADKNANPSDPDNVALSEALAQAYAAANATGNKSGDTTASLVEKAKAFTSLFGGDEKKTDRFSLMTDESQGEVNRLLASIGGENMAAPQGIGEPLFSRVHTALNRSVIRGRLKAKR